MNRVLVKILSQSKKNHCVRARNIFGIPKFGIRGFCALGVCVVFSVLAPLISYPQKAMAMPIQGVHTVTQTSNRESLRVRLRRSDEDNVLRISEPLTVRDVDSIRSGGVEEHQGHTPDNVSTGALQAIANNLRPLGVVTYRQGENLGFAFAIPTRLQLGRGGETVEIRNTEHLNTTYPEAYMSLDEQTTTGEQQNRPNTELNQIDIPLDRLWVDPEMLPLTEGVTVRAVPVFRRIGIDILDPILNDIQNPAQPGGERPDDTRVTRGMTQAQRYQLFNSFMRHTYSDILIGDNVRLQAQQGQPQQAQQEQAQQEQGQPQQAQQEQAQQEQAQPQQEQAQQEREIINESFFTRIGRLIGNTTGNIRGFLGDNAGYLLHAGLILHEIDLRRIARHQRAVLERQQEAIARQQELIGAIIHDTRISETRNDQNPLNTQIRRNNPS